MNALTSIPVRRSEQLGEKIEEWIVTGVYAPGMRLDEQELADAFGVSRTPVREALIQLASAGLVDMRPRRGATVPEMSADRLCEMFEVMAELEAMCGRLAARRILPGEQARLLEAHQACEAARDACNPDLYYQRNEVLHRCIYEASHNGFLAEQATALHRRLRLRVRDRMRNSYSEHAAVVDAILRGDSDLAASLLRGHVVIQGQRFTDLIASLRQMNNAA
jgi:DNA-binding GntR family transcriptional regulator